MNFIIFFIGVPNLQNINFNALNFSNFLNFSFQVEFAGMSGVSCRKVSNVSLSAKKISASGIIFALVQFIPMQVLHATEHDIPFFLQPHILPQSASQPQNVSLIILGGAGSLVILMGTRTLFFISHPQLVGFIEIFSSPCSHCCTCRYVCFKFCKTASADGITQVQRSS